MVKRERERERERESEEGRERGVNFEWLPTNANNQIFIRILLYFVLLQLARISINASNQLFIYCAPHRPIGFS
jgi:hypothetical protein